tara:strand:+ start:22 stop:918 length:897 start_codon:yes stop_codon:yes gene_type:complete
LNFLITGGAGFLGRALAIELAKNKKNKVYIIDKVKFNFYKKNIFFIKSDLKKKIFKKNNFSYIFHMAAELGVKNVINNSIYTLDTNYITTKNIINFAKKNKNLKRIFFFSTSEVYSNLNKKKLMNENDKLLMPNIQHPRSSYWIGKIIGEFLIINSNIPYTIFRIFNVYGKNVKTTHVIPSIFHKLKNHKKPLFENPSHTRSFIYIDDIIKIFLKSLNNKFKNQTINVGNPYEPIKIKDLVKKISYIMKINKKVYYKNFDNQSIKTRIPDIQKLKKLIGKFQFTKLNNGLNEINKKYD